MITITKNNLSAFLKGSLLFATGGGFSPSEHKTIMDGALHITKKLHVKSVNEFKQNEHLCSIYRVGDPSKTHAYTKKFLITLTKWYERQTGILVKGIIPGEIGAEGIAFLASAHLSIPVVDSDLVGGRAAPEVHMDTFSIHRVPLTPLVGMSTTGKQIFLKGAFSAEEIEKILRHSFLAEGGGILLGYPITAGHYRKIGALGTLSRALHVGALLEHNDIEGVVDALGGTLRAHASLLRVHLKSEKGFFQGWIQFQGWKIWVKNETIALYRGNELVTVGPDLIVMLSKSGNLIHATELIRYQGKEVVIITIPAEGYWKNPRARKLWQSAVPSGANH